MERRFAREEFENNERPRTKLAQLKPEGAAKPELDPDLEAAICHQQNRPRQAATRLAAHRLLRWLPTGGPDELRVKLNGQTGDSTWLAWPAINGTATSYINNKLSGTLSG